MCFRVAFSPGINVAMIMRFKLYPFSYFEFALNLFMSEVGCSLAELSSMSLLFLSVFQWLQSVFLFFNGCNLVFVFQP